MKSLSDIQKELGVETLVLMGQSKTTNKASSIATFGLRGCTCVVAEKGSEVFLGHYPPTDFQKLHADVQAFSPEKVTIFTPGEYVKIGDRWKNKPQHLLLEHLHPTVYPYSEAMRVGEALWDRAVVYRNGSIVHSFF